MLSSTGLNSYTFFLASHASSFSFEELVRKDIFECWKGANHSLGPECDLWKNSVNRELRLMEIYKNRYFNLENNDKKTCMTPVQKYMSSARLYEDILSSHKRFCDYKANIYTDLVGNVPHSEHSQCYEGAKDAAAEAISFTANDHRLEFITGLECPQFGLKHEELDQMTIPAGFDCKKATGKIEKAICENSNLSYYDHLMSSIYFYIEERIGRTESLENLKKSQRSWLIRRNSVCNEYEDLSLHSCIYTVYMARVQVLLRGLEFDYW